MSYDPAGDLWIGIVLVCLVVGAIGAIAVFAYVGNTPEFKEAAAISEQIRQAEIRANTVTISTIITSCTYDIINNVSNIYLNNGTHLTYKGNLNLKVGLNYTISYERDSGHLLTWSIAT